MQSLKNVTKRLWLIPEIRGVGSLGFLRYATKALALGRILILTRWFTPEEMGVYGVALLILAIAEVTTETGVNVILLKHPEKLKSYIHTAWLVSIVRGGLIAVAILLLAQPLSGFFEPPTLPALLMICALAAAIKGFINPAVISFQQNLEFGKETLYRTPLQVFDLVAGLVLAWIMQDVLGLLLGLVLASVMEVLSSFWIFTLRPRLTLAKWSQLAQLYRETRTIVVNGVVQYFTEHSDDLLIGRLLGPAALGVYQTAYKLVSAITIDLAAVVGQALYPIYAANAEKPKAVRKSFPPSTSLFFPAMIPVAIALLIFPQQITRLLFGPEWGMVGTILPILFFGAIAKSGLSLITPLVILKNRVSALLGVNVFIIVSMLSGIYFLSPQFGVQGAAWAVCLSMVAAVPLMLLLAKSALRKS